MNPTLKVGDDDEDTSSIAEYFFIFFLGPSLGSYIKIHVSLSLSLSLSLSTVSLSSYASFVRPFKLLSSIKFPSLSLSLWNTKKLKKKRKEGVLVYMDEYSRKRGSGGVVIPRRGSSVVMKEAVEDGSRSAQFCNRLGCNGRLKHSKGSQTGCSVKLDPKPSPPAKNGKEVIGSSSRTSSVMMTRTRKSYQETWKKLSTPSKTDTSESSISVHDEPEVLSEVARSPGKVLNDGNSGNIRTMEVGSSSVLSNSRPQKVFRQKSALGTQNTLPGPPVPAVSKNTNQGPRNIASSGRYGLRSFRCSSVADVVSSGSSSESNQSRKKDIVKKRNTEADSSSSSVRSKKMSGPLIEDSRSSSSTPGIDPRASRNWIPGGGNGVGSVRTRRSFSGNPRTRNSYNQGNGNTVSQLGIPVGTLQQPQEDLPDAVDVPGSFLHFSAEASSSRSTSFSRPGSSSRSGSSDGSLAGTMRNALAEHGVTRSLVNRDSLMRYNMNGIAEVLLALERIEQDQELSYEELIALESNLFVGGLGFYDRHRDMRLDIDHMSYEELLALEEKMGNVSTALSEDSISKCLKRSIYQATPSKEDSMDCSGSNEHDVKCSICQEEYAKGDDMGWLDCDHGYHAECIEGWLRLKNWCPVCKKSAAAGSSSSA